MNILKIYQDQLEQIKLLYQYIIANSKVVYTENGTSHKLRIHIVDGSLFS